METKLEPPTKNCEKCGRVMVFHQMTVKYAVFACLNCGVQTPLLRLRIRAPD